jgi:hypothetical protein
VARDRRSVTIPGVGSFDTDGPYHYDPTTSTLRVYGNVWVTSNLNVENITIG